MAAAEAGVMMVCSFVASAGGWLGAIGAWAVANPIMAGALVGGIYSGAQTAINGGSISDVLKSAAIGAVTGAIGGAIGGPLGTVAGEVSGAVGGGVAGEVAGAVVHAAAHGVVGGATSLAMGGTFQDGFIGSAIGAGVSSAMGAIPGLNVLEGPGVAKVIGRTAVASISGGVAARSGLLCSRHAQPPASRALPGRAPDFGDRPASWIRWFSLAEPRFTTGFDLSSLRFGSMHLAT